MNAFEAAGIVIPDSLDGQLETFQELWEELKNLMAPYSALDDLGVLYIPEQPQPQTPYSYNSKIWIHDKRPVRHYIRNNCRKGR